jgi:hypothetical protein
VEEEEEEEKVVLISGRGAKAPLSMGGGRAATFEAENDSTSDQGLHNGMNSSLSKSTASPMTASPSSGLEGLHVHFDLLDEKLPPPPPSCHVTNSDLSENLNA